MEKHKRTESEVGSRLKDALFEKYNVSDKDAVQILDVLMEGGSAESRVEKLRTLDISNADEILTVICVLSLYVSIASKCAQNSSKTEGKLGVMGFSRMSEAELLDVITQFSVAFQERATTPETGLKALFTVVPILIATGLFPAHMFTELILVLLDHNSISLADLVHNCEMVSSTIKSVNKAPEGHGTLH